MIKEIKITNFYSFSEETIILQPDVNILIGINGSGKSNFLKAVRLLKEGVSGMGVEKYIFDVLGGIDNIIFKGKQEMLSKSAIEIQYIFEGNAMTQDKTDFSFNGDIVYSITINRVSTFQNYYIQERIATKAGFVYLRFDNGIGHLRETFKASIRINNKANPPVKKEKIVSRSIKYTEFNPKELALKQVSDPERYWALATIKRAVNNIDVYDYFDTRPGSNLRRSILATSDKRLKADGSNLTQILNTIKINFKEAYNSIIKMLGEVNANFSGFNYNIYGGGNIELLLEEKELDSSIHVSNISDGTLRYLCLLAILYNPERGKFICIDEPETGLHPDMVRSIANAIKKASEYSTIIIATHSVGLLNYFRVENLQVFEKDENNATRVVTYNEEQFEGWYNEFTQLGKKWMAGDFGGVRYGG